MNTLELTVLNINDLSIEVADSGGGTFVVNRQDLDYIAHGGGTSERQYHIYQIALQLADANVNLNDEIALATHISDMTVRS